MDNNWVLQKIRTACLHRLVAWGIALGCVVLFLAAEHRYIVNFFGGPFELGKTELDAISDVSAAPRYYARVTGSKAINTGIQQITVRKRAGVETSRSVSGQFYVLLVGDRLLVVKSSAGAQTTSEGELRAMHSELEGKFFGTPDMQAIKKRFYAFYVDDSSFRLPGYIGAAVIVLFGFLLYRFGVPSLRHFLAPSSHPVARKLASWGDPGTIAAEAELESRTPRHKSGGWLVTGKYFIQSTFFTFDVLRMSDLLWAYKRVTSSNLVKKYNAVLVCSDAKIDIRGSEKNVDAILTSASERAPWAVFGFSTEIEEQFNKKQQDFRAAVEQRRRD